MSHQSNEAGRDDLRPVPVHDETREADAQETKAPADQLNPYHQQAQEFDANNPGGAAMDRQ